MPLVRGIYRYPIKGLSPQPLHGVELTAEKPLPFDRVFALTRPEVPIDAEQPTWRKKGLFLMLMFDEALAQVHTQLDVQTLEFEVTRTGQPQFRANLESAPGRNEVERFFQALVPTLKAPPRLVRSSDGHFMDKPDNVVSLINLATVRDLEARWGYPIDPLRFRANFYIDGCRPWEEFDWIGRDLLLGEALLRVDRRNGRCSATNVYPATGQRDLDIPGSLRKDFGHKDIGVYLLVRSGGKVNVGDAVELPRSQQARPAQTTPAAAPVSLVEPPKRFMCRGCYYIYDESRGAPQHTIAPGTAFADIATHWRCPDCGTDKTAFRPYVHEPLSVHDLLPGVS